MLPDIEAVAIAYLRTLPVVQTAGARVGWRRTTEPLPQVVVNRDGGQMSWPPGSLDEAELEIAVWAARKEDCRALAQAVREGMLRAAATTVGGVFIAGASELVGLAYLPDEQTEATPIYAFTIVWTFH